MGMLCQSLIAKFDNSVGWMDGRIRVVHLTDLNIEDK